MGAVTAIFYNHDRWHCTVALIHDLGTAPDVFSNGLLQYTIMNAGTTNILSRAATTSRALCPAHASRQNRFQNEVSRRQPSRAICSVTPHQSRRPSVAATRSSLNACSQSRAFHPTSKLQATKNPYTVLGVDKNASAGDIKKAYYGLAKKYHPDTNKDPTAKDRFAEAQSAYELLTDAQKKAAWDQFGAGFGADFNFEDLFKGFTGGRRGRSSPGRNPFQEEILVGENIETQVNISFMEAAKGTSKAINLTLLSTCKTCS